MKFTVLTKRLPCKIFIEILQGGNPITNRTFYINGIASSADVRRLPRNDIVWYRFVKKYR